MSDTNIDTNASDDLDLFSADFFGQKAQTDDNAGAATPTETEDIDDEGDANHIETDTLADEDDIDDEDNQEPEEKEPENKPKKNRLQERIDELTAGRREAERREAEKANELARALARISELEQKPSPRTERETSGPSPDDKNEDGTDKYPLGDFDPQYIRDLTKHALAEERQKMLEEEAKTAEQKEMEAAREALQSSWNSKLEPAQERYPDFREKSEEMIRYVESRIDPAYGEYLTARIMDMEYGTDVLYYLANNLDETMSILNSGPAKATLALGRLEAKFMDAEAEKQLARPKVSKAPPPPAHINKGSAVARVDVPADTDDLDAFDAMFFKKRR